MNDGEREYVQMLTSMEQEVLNLKTAHQRPLGTLNFFKSSSTFTIPLVDYGGSYSADIAVVVIIATPSITPPIVQTGWSVPASFYTVDLINFSVSGDYTTWTYTLFLQSTSVSSPQLTISALSSQPVEAISWSYA